MHRSIVFILWTFLALLVSGQNIDSENSVVNFRIKNMGVNTVKGTLKNMTGTAQFNPANLNDSKFNACVSTSTIQTGNKKRDEHLRNADFFNAFKFPEICFVSNTIRKSDSGYLAIGELTLCGVTKTVEIPFCVSKNMLTGEFRLQRFDYGLGQSTGSFFAGNEVVVNIVCTIQ